MNNDEFASGDSPLKIAFANGREVTVSLCTCGGCQNEFYVPHHREFQEKFCPYCGMKFISMTIRDVD